MTTTPTSEKPPTKLENPKLFKPFEMFVQMYGLPAHNEMDPTVFVGITYSFIFGVMFGDVGQGLLLLIGGALIYHFKKAPLAGIIASAGVFSHHIRIPVRQYPLDSRMYCQRCG